MIRVVEDEVNALALFKANGYRIDPPFKGFVLCDDEGRALGVVAVSTQDGVEVEVCAIGHKIASLGAVRALFRYCFENVGAKRVSARCWSTNARTIKTLRGVGFIHEGTKRAYGPNGEDILIWGMLRHECRPLETPWARRSPTIRSQPQPRKVRKTARPR